MVNRKKLIFKYLFIISIFLMIFLAGRVYYDYTHQQDMLKERLATLYTNIYNSLDISKTNLVNNYLMLTSHFMNSQELYEYFKNNQREELYKLLKDDYSNFKVIDPNLFVMHFLDKNNITVLRMHKPNSFNDDLTHKRPIVAYVNRSLKAQNAFEVGKNGIVYRITSPFIYQDDHVGVLEFGIRLNYFTDMLTDKFNVSHAQLVKSDQLKVLVAKKQYPTIGEYSVVAQDSMFSNFIDTIDLSKNKQIIKQNGKTYLVCSHNLSNYENKVVSKILSVEDITAIMEKNNLWFKMINTSSIILYFIILTFIYIILNKFSNEIKNQLTTISKLSKKSRYLQTKANTDELTQTYNKSYFNKYLDRFLDSNSSGCILFFDIDHFKSINDTHGHLVGDKILKNLASLIQSNLRQDDVFARWGGEEFIILLNELPSELAYKKAEDLRGIVAQTPLYEEISITISIGLACIEKNKSKTELLHKVDGLLYQAKERGRNCTVC